MTANHEHTPTTEEVRLAHAESVTLHQMEEPKLTQANEMFDRWLAERDARIEAAAEQRGAVKALRDAADEFAPEWPDKPDLSATRGVSQTRKWLRNRADRIADQMEGDGD